MRGGAPSAIPPAASWGDRITESRGRGEALPAMTGHVQARIRPGIGVAASLSGNTRANAGAASPRCCASSPLATERRSAVGCRSRFSNSSAGAQARPVRRDPPARDGAAEHERDRAGAVVGALGAVHPRGAAELRHHQHRGLCAMLSPSAGLQRHQPGVELAQHARQPVGLRHMGVPAADLQRRDARAVRGAPASRRPPCASAENA